MGGLSSSFKQVFKYSTVLGRLLRCVVKQCEYVERSKKSLLLVLCSVLNSHKLKSIQSSKTIILLVYLQGSSFLSKVTQNTEFISQKQVSYLSQLYNIFSDVLIPEMLPRAFLKISSSLNSKTWRCEMCVLSSAQASVN